MKFRPLGLSGIQVSTFALGAMMFGRVGSTNFEQCARIVNRALDAGINVIDTADFYSLGESEEFLGRALATRRREVILASKCFWPMSDTDPNRRGGSRRWILQACEESLSRLRTDYLDIYYLHKFDVLSDLDESLGAMSDLVRQGKVRTVGISTFPPDRLVEAVWTAERRGHMRPRVEQPPYSILSRHIERDLLPACERFGLGVMVWSPLNGGFLTGKYRKPTFEADSRAVRVHAAVATAFDRSRPQVAHKFDAIERLSKLADEAGMPLAHLALAFSIEHPAVTSAILGPRTLEQLDDLLPAASVKLSPDVLDRIDEIVAPGTDIDPVTDAGWTPPWIEDASHRRRQGPRG